MVITKYLWPDYNRVIPEELTDTKFAGFGESLVTALSRYSITCKNTYISYGSNRRFIFVVLGLKPYSSSLLSNSRKSSEMMLFIIVVYLILIYIMTK